VTLVYAHRGAAAELPENTLPAFRRALELGADALETDVHLTLDGEVVAVHDPHGKRIAGVDRAVAGATLREVQAWDAGYAFVDAGGGRPFVGQGYRIPTLEELLGELSGVRLNIDLKQGQARLIRRFLELVRRHDAERRVVGASFRRATLEALREAGFRGETSLSRWEFVRYWLLPAGGRRPSATRAQIPIRVGPCSIATQRVVNRLHELGLAVDYWTVNDPETARRIVQLGADGVMTDDPARVVPAVRAAGG
jgi:glycerophosphoryl diester phosphodiesterase